MRTEKTAAPRRKIRSLVRRDLEPVSLTSLPDSIQLSRGHLAIAFTTVEQLAENLLLLARILESEGDEFAAAYEISPETERDPAAAEVRQMFAELANSELGR